MSNVSRSVYQSLKEENNRLLKDIAILTKPFNVENEIIKIRVIQKWRKKFAEEKEFEELLRQVALEYIKNNPDDESVKFVKSLGK